MIESFTQFVLLFREYPMNELYQIQSSPPALNTYAAFQKETKETILLLNHALRILAETEDKLHVLDMVVDVEMVEDWKDFSEQFLLQWQQFVATLPARSASVEK